MQVFANNAYSSLGASLSNSATSLTLATATGIRFPSPTGGSYFLLTLVGLDSNGNENAWEIVKVTGRASDALTIVRAQESTTAVAWAAGTRVELRATAGTFSSYATLAAPTFTGGITVSSGGASITGDTSVTGTLGVSSTLSTTSGSAVRLYRPDNATYTDISMAAGASGGLIFNNANSDGFTFKNTGSTVAQFSSTGLAVTGLTKTTTYFSANDQGYIRGDRAGYLQFQGGTSGFIWSNNGNSTDQMTLNTSGNLGLGVTPSAWAVAAKAIEFVYGSGLCIATGGDLNVTSNAYNSAAVVWSYRTSGLGSSRYQSDFGTHRWYTAPSGTAGNPITFTQAMTLDASGNLLVGTMSGTEHTLQKSAASGYAATICNTNSSDGYVLQLKSAATGGYTWNLIDGFANSVAVFKVSGNGNVTNYNNNYGAISSIKYKENVVDTSPKLAKLLKIRVVNYNLINDPAKLKQIGVIWEELNEISPGLCEETPDYEEVTLTREVEKTVQVIVKKEVTTERVLLEVIDGVAVQKVIKEVATVDEPVVDEYPVFDGDGNPVMEVVSPATEAEIDDKGNEVKAAMPAVLRQKIHTVPRMETVVDKEEYTERRLTGTTTKSVKYSIFVPMLIKAMQEQQEQIEALKAKVSA